MNTALKSKPLSNAAKVSINDPDEIRRIVALGKERGLIAPGDPMKRHADEIATPVEKNGFDLANLAGVRSQWIDVTPAMAADWLKNNFRNRPLREDTIKAYARDMITGAWVPTHQGIAFNDQDELIDGQHRLHAVVMAKITVRMMVTFGLPSKIDGREMTTMDAVDRGATRSVADQLTIQHGFKHSGIKAAVCAAVGTLCFGERTRRLSVGQTLEVYRAFERAVEYVVTHRSKQVGLRTAGVLAGFAFALATEENFWENKTPISLMLDQVNTGENIDAKSPVGLLREFLTSEQAKLFSRSLDRGLAEVVLQAIHQQLKGETIAQLEPSLDGANHFRALQPERVEKIKAMFVLPTVPKTVGPAVPKTPSSTIAEPSESPAPAPNSGRPQGQKLALIRIVQLSEAFFKIGAIVLYGKGEESDIFFARNATISVMLAQDSPIGSIAATFKRDREMMQLDQEKFKTLCAAYPKKQARYAQFVELISKNS